MRVQSMRAYGLQSWKRRNLAGGGTLPPTMPADRSPGQDPDRAATHAGGVVFRMSPEGRAYLLVRARKVPGAWVFPKGHIEPGESARQAAIREVLEEAGVAASIVAPLGRVALGAERTEMFLMACESSRGARGERDCAWLGLRQASAALAFDESRALLERADRTRETRA